MEQKIFSRTQKKIKVKLLNIENIARINIFVEVLSGFVFWFVLFVGLRRANKKFPRTKPKKAQPLDNV